MQVAQGKAVVGDFKIIADDPFGKSWWENLSEYHGHHHHTILKHSLEYTLVLVVAHIVVLFVGVFGNAVVVTVITLGSHIKKVTNYFILNLAVADMLILVSCVPATLVASLLKPWIFGSILCKLLPYIQAVSVFACVYSLVAISIDRCKAICHNSMSVGGYTYCQVKLIIALIWTVALVLHLPILFVYQLEKSDDSMYSTLCREHWQDPHLGKAYFLLVHLLLSYILPLVLISGANVTIWWKVAHRSVPVQEEGEILSSPSWLLMQRIHRKTKRGVGKTLCIATLTFFFSWLPYYILTTRIQLSSTTTEENVHGEGETTEKKVLKALLPLAKLLAYWNSIFNPVFYSFFNAHFRKMGQSVLPARIAQNILNFGDNEYRRQTVLAIRRMCAIDAAAHGGILNVSGCQVKQHCADFIGQKIDSIRYLFQYESVFSGTNIISRLKSNSVSSEPTTAAAV